MKKKRLITIVLSAVLVCNFVSCGKLVGDKKELENITYTAECSNDQIKKLCSNIECSDVNILEGDSFKVDAENMIKDKCKIEVKDDTLYIDYDYGKKNKDVSFCSNNRNEKITITIPKEHTFESFNIKADVGNVTGSAKYTIDDGSIGVGVGNLNISNVKCTNLKVDVDCGNVDLSGDFGNKTDIQSDLGNIKLNVEGGELEEYNVEADVDAGRLLIDNSPQKDSYVRNNADSDKFIRVSNGMGNIEINGI